MYDPVCATGCTDQSKILHERANNRLTVTCHFCVYTYEKVCISYSHPAIFANSIKLAFSDSAWETPSIDQDQSLQGRAKDHAS